MSPERQWFCPPVLQDRPAPRREALCSSNCCFLLAASGLGWRGAVCYGLDMSNTGGNLRYALRLMRRNPGFTLIAVTSLALGIGVNAAIFSLVDQLLLWSIPAREPSRLVKLEGGYSDELPELILAYLQGLDG